MIRVDEPGPRGDRVPWTDPAGQPSRAPWAATRSGTRRCWTTATAYHAFCAARRRKIVDAAERPITPRDAAALMAWYRRVMPEDAGRL